MSQKRARAPATIIGRDGTEVRRSPVSFDQIKEAADELAARILATLRTERDSIEPLNALLALEMVRRTVETQVRSALAEAPGEVELFDEQLAKLFARLRTVQKSGAGAPS